MFVVEKIRISGRLGQHTVFVCELHRMGRWISSSMHASSALSNLSQHRRSAMVRMVPLRLLKPLAEQIKLGFNGAIENDGPPPR